MQYPLRPRLDDKRLARQRSFILNRVSAPLRAMPDFLIIGAMKCGTSSLFRYLLQHPMVVPPIRKELHFFGWGDRQGKGMDWYRAHFPLRRSIPANALTGEATPSYIFCPGVAESIAATLPDARMILLLRDPVQRAVSHYFHEVRMGREYLPIADAMAAEEDRLAERFDNEVAHLENYLHASYKKMGLYFEQIETYLKYFRRDQILIMGSGVLFEQPHIALDETLAFLGLPKVERNYDFKIWNKGEDRADVPDSVYADLQAYFEPHNRRLFEFLGTDLNW